MHELGSDLLSTSRNVVAHEAVTIGYRPAADNDVGSAVSDGLPQRGSVRGLSGRDQADRRVAHVIGNERVLGI